jgi:hypothetical protein
MPLPLADATGGATLVVAGITLTLVVAMFALVLATRAGTEQTRDDLMEQLELLRRQFQAAYQPLLVDVPASSVDVAIEAGKVRLGVSLRNVGGGLAVVDGDGVTLEGSGIGRLESGALQRVQVPVNETTRIDLSADYRMHELGQPQHAAWQLTVPYADLAGGQRTVSRVLIVCRGEDVRGPWEVERVEHESLVQHQPSERAVSGADGGVRPPEGSAPVADSTTSREPSRQPVTDIWGNPINKRSRRRR